MAGERPSATPAAAMAGERPSATIAEMAGERPDATSADPAAAGEHPSATAAGPVPAGIDLALIDGVSGRLGVAVSGGGDSMALAVLLVELRPTLAPLLLTVDHGLRADGGADCDHVEALGIRLGLEVVRLRAGPAVGSLQAWARGERYRLLAAAAGRHGLAAVATAHTLDDQAETVLMRLARGSGVGGLAGIRRDTVVAGLRVVRPLLAVNRAELRAALRARGVGWREDPANADPRFDRTRARAALPALAAAGVPAEALAAAAARLAVADAALDAAAAAVCAAARVDRAGAVFLARSALAGPEEVRLRVLSSLATAAGGTEPRFAAVAQAAAALAAGRPATLGHAVGAVRGADVVLWRERRRIEPLSLGAGEEGVFDNRYRVVAACDVVVAALGEAARRVPRVAFLPAMAAAPAVFVAGRCVAAPTLGLRRRGTDTPPATVTPLR